ncbi:MAG: calycin-like domain-containing protein [Prevotellaceae bacterium]|jgi:hypothetical protein|nr:calycin-like domain-containing protein [Prevotellaceae bacterium]
MKKILKSFTALSLGIVLVATTGCSSDDNSEKNVDYAKVIAGDYTGLFMMGMQLIGNGKFSTLHITRIEDNKVLLSMNTTLLNLPVVGDLPLDVSSESAVTKNGESYDISGVSSVSIPQLGNDPIPVDISGTVTPSSAKASLVIKIMIGDEPIIVNFTGRNDY